MGKEIALNDDGFAVAEPTGNRFIIGGMIKYDDHVYTLNKTEPVPLGTLVALNIVTAWVEWRDHRPVRHLVTQLGQHHPAREEFGDLDSTKWPPGVDGRPADPFKDSRYLHLIDPQTGQDFTFVTDTNGGRIAVGELKSAICNVRMVRPGAVAVVKLATGTFKSKKFGLVPRPVFKVVEYRGGLKEEPAQIADQSKPEQVWPPDGEVKASSLAQDLNDDLPDFVKAPKAEAPKAEAPKKKHKK
jgi:hypothetical protein